MTNDTATQTRPAKLRLCGLWKNSINNKRILTGKLCTGIQLVLIPVHKNPDSREPNALLYSVTKDMLRTARDNGIEEDTFKGYRVTGLWLKESRTGKYYAGDWEPDTSLFVFRNNNQQPGKNQPDYEVFLLPRVRQDRKAESPEEQEIFDEKPDDSPEDDWMDFLKEKDRGLNNDFEGLSFD